MKRSRAARSWERTFSVERTRARSAAFICSALTEQLIVGDAPSSGDVPRWTRASSGCQPSARAVHSRRGDVSDLLTPAEKDVVAVDPRSKSRRSREEKSGASAERTQPEPGSPRSAAVARVRIVSGRRNLMSPPSLPRSAPRPGSVDGNAKSNSPTSGRSAARKPGASRRTTTSRGSGRRSPIRRKSEVVPGRSRSRRQALHTSSVETPLRLPAWSRRSPKRPAKSRRLPLFVGQIRRSATTTSNTGSRCFESARSTRSSASGRSRDDPRRRACHTVRRRFARAGRMKRSSCGRVSSPGDTACALTGAHSPLTMARSEHAPPDARRLATVVMLKSEVARDRPSTGGGSPHRSSDTGNTASRSSAEGASVSTGIEPGPRRDLEDRIPGSCGSARAMRSLGANGGHCRSRRN